MKKIIILLFISCIICSCNKKDTIIGTSFEETSRKWHTLLYFSTEKKVKWITSEIITQPDGEVFLINPYTNEYNYIFINNIITIKNIYKEKNNNLSLKYDKGQLIEDVDSEYSNILPKKLFIKSN